jgi:flavin reductase (DIM6/NTAB) family NADH-FMN oxidoreductase RutF
MEKISISPNAFLYPMPMALVGALVDGKPNFLAVGWIARVNFQPPMIAISLGPHYTNTGIEEQKIFTVNIPDVSLLDKTDYCGLVSGKKTDKSQIFDVFYGQSAAAPLIRECPLSMVCRLVEQVKLPSNTLYIGEIFEAFSEERYLTDGKPDIAKMKPFSLTMPDNGYWAVGDRLGSAWSIGKKLKKSE